MAELGGCTTLHHAIVAVNVRAAELELQGSCIRASLSMAGATVALVVWGVLLVSYYRFLKGRVAELAVELGCLVLCVVSLTATVFAIDESNPDRRLPFTVAVEKELRRYSVKWSENFMLRLPQEWRVALVCEQHLSLDKSELHAVRKRLELLERAHRTRPEYVVAIMLCVVIVIALITSVAIAIRAGMKFHEAPSDKTDCSDPSLLQSLPTSVRSFKPLHNSEYLSEFFEIVPQLQGGVVLHAAPHCSICFEPMLEDMARLHICSHLFHRRCLLRWLAYRDKLVCPRCGQPLSRWKAISSRRHAKKPITI